MKRIVCLLLCLLLAMTSVMATAADYYSSEPEKLLRQFVRGSGLKGTLMINTAGTAPWAVQLAQMNGVELQLRALDSKQGMQYRLYVDRDEGMTAMTEIVGDAKTACLTSDFLMGSVYSFPAENGLISALLDLGNQNTNWITLAQSIMMVQNDTIKDKWVPELSGVLNAIDSWLTPYLSTETVNKDGATLILTRYEIPASAVKEQIKAILPALLNNRNLMELLTAQASDAQAALYLQPGYITYYDQVIDAMPLSGNVVLERTTTLKGENVGILLDLPVSDTVSGLKEVSYAAENDDVELDLFFADRTVQFQLTGDGTEAFSGFLRVMRAEGESFSAAYTATATKAKQTDEKSRNHEEYDWQITLEPDLTHLDLLDPARASYATFETTKVHVNAHLYSKNGDTSAVTASILLELSDGTNEVNANLTLKTASPWQLPELPEGAKISLNDMTDAERSSLLNDWFNNGLAALSLLKPEESATLTDLQPAE